MYKYRVPYARPLLKYRTFKSKLLNTAPRKIPIPQVPTPPSISSDDGDGDYDASNYMLVLMMMMVRSVYDNA